MAGAIVGLLTQGPPGLLWALTWLMIYCAPSRL